MTNLFLSFSGTKLRKNPCSATQINALFSVVEKYENEKNYNKREVGLLFEKGLHHFPVHPEVEPALRLAQVDRTFKKKFKKLYERKNLEVEPALRLAQIDRTCSLVELNA